MRQRIFAALLVLTLPLAACHRGPAAGAAQDATDNAVLTNRLWELIELNGSINPLGEGLSPITLRLERSTNRVRGFGGCNRYTGSYTMTGNIISFGPPAATQLSCVDGMQLEASFFRTLPLVRAYALFDGILVLSSNDGVVARFRRR